MRQECIDKLKQINLPIYIWGSGEIASLAKKSLNKEGIDIEGFVIDEKYIKSEYDLTKDKVIALGKPYILVKGFLGTYYMSESNVKDMWPGCESVITITDIYEPVVVEPMSKSFYLDHKNQFDEVRNNLADKLSADAFDSYIDAKITLSNHSILPIVEPKQYFFDSAPWNYDDSDILIEGGAYNGDSILDFVHLRGEAYKEILAFEPDINNYILLKKNIQNNSVKRVKAFNCGLYSNKTTLRFSSAGTMESTISAQGDVELKVDTIDNVAVNEKVTIIKMDVEGSEMDVLIGAESTIKRCRPILMISAYHKKDDIYSIYNFISHNVNHYSYYFRCHKPLAIDAVLYAVPNERLK